ncbi:MAG TPA: (Fe-S)-binding protein [Candidatus Aminicenantes bacterium]|nr:(Fe-S)-binding protein [Candidatus Aminicenantes bacterium]
MADATARHDPYQDKLDSLTDADLAAILAELRRRLKAPEIAAAHTCIRCGLCADACHYYLTNGELEDVPAHKLNLVLGVIKHHFLPGGRRAGGWVGARKLDKAVVREWVDALFGRCSGCGRCTVNCTSGINIHGLIRAARGALAAAGLVPPELQSTVMTAVEQGNNMGIPRDEWLETVDWIQDELRAETGDPGARIPVDEKGARLLYTVNPREPKFFPLSLLAAAKLFHAAGESWTFSSDRYDVTNYGLYSGDDSCAGLLSGRLVQAREDLGAEVLVLGECGHGFASTRWEAPQWLNRRFGFPVKSVLEVAAEYVRQGRVRLDPSKNKKPLTLHDPCNLVRLGGVVEEQRYLLENAVEDFREMTPNRRNNYCCGGGGGQLAMTRFAKRRLAAGRLKAEQIRATGAMVVVAPCHNCIDQLTELGKEYGLGTEVKTVIEIVADALVLPRKNA